MSQDKVGYLDRLRAVGVPDLLNDEDVMEWVTVELSNLHAAACDGAHHEVHPKAAIGTLQRLSAYDVRLIAHALAIRLSDAALVAMDNES